MSILEGVVIEERESRLIQKDRNGGVISEIDIGRGYTISTPYVGYAEAIYRVKQNDQMLEFCTRTKDAEHLVKNVLKLKGEYPPVAPWNFGW